jgi:hypothetical protein
MVWAMSSQQLSPDKAHIFRILHRGNLLRLLEHGCVCRNNAEPRTYVEIGNQELIARRKDREVPCEPGGTLGDYVPFYFTPYSPMLYNIKTGYGVPQQPMSDILILVSSLPLIAKNKIPFVYSDRHAYLRTALFSNDLSELGNRIAWKALQERDFSKSDVDRFEKYQAEALVYKHVPLGALLGIMCHNDSMKDEVAQVCAAKGLDLKIINGRSWYL